MNETTGQFIANVSVKYAYMYIFTTGDHILAFCSEAVNAARSQLTDAVWKV